MSSRLQIAAGALLFALGLVLANTLPVSERVGNALVGVLGALGGIVFFSALEKRRRRK